MMRIDLPEGRVSMTWPDDLSVESAETMAQLLELQVRGVLRWAKLPARAAQSVTDEVTP
jgi:hypothetical protein